MKKLIIILLLIILIAVGGACYALSNPVELEAPKVILTPEEGTVWVNEREVKGELELKENDLVKTGENALASINFFDESIVRLDENTEILLKDLQSENFTTKKINFKINLGHLWARILKLVDKDAEFSIETPTTVASVRGTAFDLLVSPEGEVEIDVDENTVEVEGVEINEGNYLKLSPGFKKQKEYIKTLIKRIPEEKLKSKWVLKNKEKDELFKKFVEKKEEKIKKLKAGILPTSPFYGLKRFSEKIRLGLTFNPERKEKLKLEYLERRFNEAQKLLDHKKEKLSKKLLNEYELGLKKALARLDEFKNKGNKKAVEMIRRNLKRKLLLQQKLLFKELPDSPRYKLKRKSEEWLKKLIEDPKEREKLEKKLFQKRVKEIRKIIKEKPEAIKTLKENIPLEKLEPVLNQLEKEKINLPKDFQRLKEEIRERQILQELMK